MNNVIKSYLKATGINFSFEEKDELEYLLHLELRDINIAKTEGYLLNFFIGDTRGILELSFETFSKTLLEQFKKITKEDYELLVTMANSLSGEIILKDNGIILNGGFDVIQNASDIVISYESQMYDLRKEDNINALLGELARVAEMFVMTCFPYTANELGEEEGNKTEILSNKYERSRKNRSQCIAYYGNSCFICKFNFESHYGDIAKGFIHVHHKKLVSDMKESQTIDPISDLVPLCPNCHAVAHLKSPPYTPDEVMKMLGAKKNG
jgi:hypothetical protein